MPGLSRRDNPPPLLSTFNKKPRPGSGEKPATFPRRSPNSSNEGATARFIVPNSDDDSLDGSPKKSKKPLPLPEDIDDSDSSDHTVRGDISKTNFGTAKAPPQSAKATPRSGAARKPSSDPVSDSKSEDKSPRAGDRKRKRLSGQATSPKISAPSGSSSQIPLSQASSSSGSHLHDEYGRPKPRKSITTYGSKPLSQFQTKFSGSKTNRASASRFKPPPSSTGSNDTDQSPDTFRDTKKDGLAPSQSASEAASRGKKKKKKGRRIREIDEDCKSPEFTKPVFKSFSEDAELFDFAGDNLKLTPPDLTLLDDLSGDGLGKSSSEAKSDGSADSAPATTSCPWCGEEVSADLLLGFSKGQRLNIRQQTRFCAQHKKHTALDEYKSRCYPAIDWDELPSRIDAHSEHILAVINGDSSSFYRNSLASKVASGKDRALKKEGNLNPGYYGPRGFNLMCEQLVVRFSQTLKERAVEDRVISGRGTASFVQTVLVAELAVQLIMEDMGVPAEEARDIMEESKAIGEAVHDDP